MDSKLRAEIDLRNEKISYKVREHSSRKIPIIFVVSKNEMKDKTVSIRRLGSDNQEIKSIENAIDEILKESNIP